MNSPHPVEDLQKNRARFVGHDFEEHDPLLNPPPYVCSMCRDTWCKCEDLNYR